jgi:hypothetical protein
MERYGNRSGTSGVEAFKIGDGSIAVRFADGATYLYDRDKPGPHHVARMIERARAGAGLATYINRRVRENYARKME